MTTALIVFLVMSMLGSFINVVATAGSQEYSSELKTVIIMLKAGWFTFATVLLVHLCSQ